jgi:serine/threonine-protein kinase
VVHRDIKPENILLTKDGSTLVADFGIARGLAGSDDKLTETGMTVGTVAYMSPEQASGEAVDARSDIYALGAVLFEMLAGEPPFTGPTAQAIVVKRLTQSVPSLRALRPSVPEGVDRAVHRALAPIAADRFGTAAEFGRALQEAFTTSGAAAATPASLATTAASPTLAVTASRPTRRRVPVAAVTLGLGFLIGLGVLFAWRRSHPAGESGGPKRVAVLPFENLGDSADAYFADGITNELRGKLSQVAGLAVIARASSNEYRHTTKSPQEIARELGADYLLTATVQWQKVAGAPNRVRVSPELVRVAPGAAPTTTWQQGFDAALTDVFQVQADIAGQVVTALNVALGDSVRRELAAPPTASLGAYDAFLKGEAAWLGGASTDPGSLRRAIGWYEQAVALDSTFLGAWAQLARTRANLYLGGTPTRRLAEDAKAAAERARRLGPDRAESFLALATYLQTVEGNLPRARATLVSGLQVAPNNVDLLTSVAVVDSRSGNFEAALPGFQRAAALDPRSVRIARNLTVAFVSLRRFDAADSAADRMIALAPTSHLARLLKAAVAVGRGDLAGAQAVARTAVAAADSAVLALLAAEDPMYWILDDEQQQHVLTLPPSAFDDDRAVWGMARAQFYHLRGNGTLARVYADSARLALETQLREAPEDAQLRGMLGLALAYLGRTTEAVREGQRGATLMPVSRDYSTGTYLQYQLARIYVVLGEPERALDQLEPLLRRPSPYSPAGFRINPDLAPLRGNPRFERLTAATN